MGKSYKKTNNKNSDYASSNRSGKMFSSNKSRKHTNISVNDAQALWEAQDDTDFDYPEMEEHEQKTKRYRQIYDE